MTARRVVRTFLALVATLASSVDGQLASPQTARATRKLTPIDAARHDASLRTLRDAVLKAADARDATRLQPLLASQVLIDFDKALTPAEVVNEIKSYSPSDQRCSGKTSARRSNSASFGGAWMSALRTSASN